MASEPSPPVSQEYISPDRAGRSLLTMLALAEMYERWGLFWHLVKYVTDADGRFEYVAPGKYIISYPSDQLPKGT